MDVDGIRVAHAAWQAEDIANIQGALKTQGNFTVDFLHMAARDGSELQQAIENVLKGPELQLPAGHFILDKANHKRDTVRIKWYESGAGRTYREYHLGSDEVPDVAIKRERLRDLRDLLKRRGPVFVGHYWLTGTPKPLATNVACTDYSVAKRRKAGCLPLGRRANLMRGKVSLGGRLDARTSFDTPTDGDFPPSS